MKTSSIRDVQQLFLTKHYSFNLEKVKLKAVIREMYPRIFW